MADQDPDSAENPPSSGAPRPIEEPNRATPAEMSEIMSRNLRMRTKRVPRAIRRNYFLYLLFYEGFFRWAVAGALVSMLVVIALVPRIWITSPAGFVPIKKVRGLDIIQGSSFRRAALREEAAGRSEEAISKWLAAMSSDSANVEAMRGYLRTLAHQKKPNADHFSQGGYEANELLRITGTNADSVTLAAEFFSRYDQYGWVLENLDAAGAPTNLVASRSLLGALIIFDRFERFQQVWKERESVVKDDPESRLFHQVWLVQKGTPSEARAARSEIELAAKDPVKQVSVLRFCLFLDQKEMSIAEFERHLGLLEAVHGARFHDRFVFLLLLKAAGRSDDAAKLARTKMGEPESALDALQLLQVWSEFQMYPEAAEFAQKSLSRFKYSPLVWVRLGDLLAAGKNWDELRALGVLLRNVELIKPVLGNYGWFLEGVGLRGLHRDEVADDAFVKFLSQPTAAEDLNYAAARKLSQIGYPKHGLTLLKTMTGSTNAGVVFWKQYLLTALEARNSAELLLAARRAYELDPSAAEVKNDYAAALLTLREKPAEALRLTLDLIGRFPASVSIQINHAQALAQNHRLADCQAVIDSIDVGTMPSAQLNEIHLARFELLQQQGKSAEARAVAEKINRTSLFPEQVEWLKKSLAGIPKT